MSRVTTAVLHVDLGFDGDEGVITSYPFGVPEYPQHFRKVTDHAGGHKVADDVYVAGFNYVSSHELLTWFRTQPFESAAMTWCDENGDMGVVTKGSDWIALEAD